LAAAAIATASAVAPSSAAASIVNAASLLPPGESGFVSIPGVATGTGSPHLYDRQQPFIAFDRKDAIFGQPGTEEDPIAGVKIVRDAFATPYTWSARFPASRMSTTTAGGSWQ
jgi:hypothetical protein